MAMEHSYSICNQRSSTISGAPAKTRINFRFSRNEPSRICEAHANLRTLVVPPETYWNELSIAIIVIISLSGANKKLLQIVKHYITDRYSF